MRLPLTLLILSLSLSLELYSQVIQGVVLAADSKSPLPYASIYLQQSKQGTVSNRNGEFNINITNSNDSIIVSYIGYKKNATSVNSINLGSRIVIQLVPAPNLLNEVVIVPTDTLLDMLRRAHSKISQNYPDYGVLIDGFYRETNQLIPQGTFLYFSESIIQFFKPSYANRQFGPVKIIEGAKAETIDRAKYSSAYFYAGLYAPQRFDFVKDRAEFIDPGSFEKYIFEITGIIKGDANNDIYIINFDSQKNGLYKGKFYLDKNTLAYLQADYELSDYGLTKENSNFSKFKYSERRYVAKFRLVDDKWNIFFVLQDGEGATSETKQKIRYTNEYVSISFLKTEKHGISDAESVPYSGIYTQYEEKFSSAFWKKPETIARSKELQKSVDFLFDRDHVMEGDTVKATILLADTTTHKKSLKTTFREGLLDHLSIGLCFGLIPLSVSASQYTVNFQNTLQASGDLAKKVLYPVLGSDIKYYHKKSYAISARMYYSLNESMYISYASVGFEWSKLLTGWRNSLYFQPSVNFYYSEFSSHIGDARGTQTVVINGKTFDSKTVKIGLGELRYGVLPSIQLVYKTSKPFSFFIDAQTSVLSGSRSKVFFEEKESILTRKRVKITPDDDNVVIFQNGTETESTSTHFSNYTLFAALGIRIGVK
jgi:hypothetical protein